MTTNPRIRGELRNWHQDGEVYTGEIYNDSLHASLDGTTIIIKPTEVVPNREGKLLYVDDQVYYIWHARRRGALL